MLSQLWVWLIRPARLAGSGVETHGCGLARFLTDEKSTPCCTEHVFVKRCYTVKNTICIYLTVGQILISFQTLSPQWAKTNESNLAFISQYRKTRRNSRSIGIGLNRLHLSTNHLPQHLPPNPPHGSQWCDSLKLYDDKYLILGHCHRILWSLPLRPTLNCWNPRLICAVHNSLWTRLAKS
jgi:hypothetical protein